MTITDSTEDLALLDDDTRHAKCTACYPDPRVGRPFTALCGRRAIGFVGTTEHPPANACPDCLDVLDDPCRVCGA
jgi:hypothetical protein